MHCNVRSLRAHLHHFESSLDTSQPTMFSLNETWLDGSVKALPVHGYTCVSRRDRHALDNRGGIATYVRTEQNCIVHLEDSLDCEISWHILHVNLGPVLFVSWYRQRDDLNAINVFIATWQRLSADTIGIIVVGDLNVHHSSWLVHSSGNTPAGRLLWEFCRSHGFRQTVPQPTHGDYLLDLVLTDLDSLVTSTVHPGISDHDIVSSTLNVSAHNLFA